MAARKTATVKETKTKAKPKVLVAVVTCHQFKDRADSQRETWVEDAKRLGLDVKFFVGRNHRGVQVEPDTVVLDVDDGYEALPQKVVSTVQWALDNGYERLFKTDDDTYVRVDRLLKVGFEDYEYAGRLRGPSGGYKFPYASGFSYWLGLKAMNAVAESEPTDVAEDRHVGNLLHGLGFKCRQDARYVVIRSDKNALSGKEGPRVGNDVITAGELRPDEMRQMHEDFEKPSEKFPPLEGKYDNVEVMVKTFLRDGFLFYTIDELPKALPGARMIIVDDGYEAKRKITRYADLRRRGHACTWLSFDSGFCAKSNEAVRHIERPYLLIASDDFDFSRGQSVAAGIDKLIDVLESDPEIGVASGRVGGNPYEGFLKREGSVITEVPLDEDKDPHKVAKGGTKYYEVDITVNYCLVRAEVFSDGQIKWDEQYKIGGDHFEFFDQVKQAGWKVAFVPGVNIKQQDFDHSAVHPEYARYRGRARQALPAFFQKYGLTKYVAFDGRADVKLEDGRIADVAPENFVGARRLYVAASRLYITADGQIVDPSDPRPKSLFMAKGRSILWEEAVKHGLVDGHKKQEED